MTLHGTRLALAFIMLCAAAGYAFPQEAALRLPKALAQALQQSGIPAASVGIYVQDVSACEPVLAAGDERAFNPASVSERVVQYPAARAGDSSRISPVPSSRGAFGSRGRSPFQ